MARDRKRAKQRQQRRAQQRAAIRPSQPHRESVPGELAHASGGPDEFDAALVAGADGQEAEPRAEDAFGRPDSTGLEAEEALPESDSAPVEEWDAEDYEDADAELAAAAVGAGAPVPAAGGRAAPRAERRDGNAVTNFLRASWAELQRVQWPDRRQVAQATAVVLGFVALAGTYLGVADAIFSRFVDAIL